MSTSRSGRLREIKKEREFSVLPKGTKERGEKEEGTRSGKTKKRKRDTKPNKEAKEVKKMKKTEGTKEVKEPEIETKSDKKKGIIHNNLNINLTLNSKVTSIVSTF